MIMKFRKKPVEIDAMNWDGSNIDGILLFCEGFAHYQLMVSGVSKMVISTKEGDMIATIGDWIIKGVKGEFYPCKPDIFDMTYDAVVV